MGRIVIAGLGAGGFAAVLAARRADRNAEITIVDDKTYDLMHPCGLPYAVEGAIDNFDKLRHDLHLDKMRVQTLHPFRAERIDMQGKTLEARHMETGETASVPYDKLILAMGARPLAPPIPGLSELIGRGAFTISCPEDAQNLRESAKPGMRAWCLGAGAIGTEVAVALKELGLDVTIVEMLETVFPRALDPDMAALVREHLEAHGFRVLCGKRLEAVRGDGAVQSVVVDGEQHPADILVVAAGVRANVEIAAAAGITVESGGIPVNERMESSVADIYAIGDCARTRSVIDGKPFTLQLSTTAYRQGTVAGTNAAGGKAAYPGVSGAFVSKLAGLEVAAVGYNTAFATESGYNPIFGKIKDATRFDWYPGAEPITVKVIADGATGRVLGAQAVGREGAAWRVNVVAAAVHAGLTLDKLSEVELAYCPPVSQTYDPLTKAVDLALRKIKT